MIVPLTLGDFLERAEFVYGDREATGKLQKFKLREPYRDGRARRVN